MKARRPGAALLPAALAVLLISSSARATDTNQTDPDDTGGKFDVSEVMFFHDIPDPFWTIETYPEWKIRSVWDKGFMIIDLDTVGDAAPDYYVLIRSNGRGLKGTLFEYRSGEDRKLGPVAAGRTNRRTAWARFFLFDRVNFDPSRTSYRWSILTLYTGGSCNRVCFDSVPDSGMVEQDLPATGAPESPAAPEPTTTPEPAESPEPAETPAAQPSGTGGESPGSYQSPVI
ncbi:MAG: hypothetical protein WD276_01740 [Actinomycetota bacterium]